MAFYQHETNWSLSQSVITGLQYDLLFQSNEYCTRINMVLGGSDDLHIKRLFYTLHGKKDD